MKRPSLIYQTKEILSPLFDEGFGKSRHSDKQNKSVGNIIYSRNSYNSILEKCCTFVKYCKENHGIRYLGEIQPDYFINFIKNGNESKGYNKNTANAYKTAIQKLQNAYNEKFNENYVWVGQLNEIPLDTLKNKLQMPRKIHDEIINRAYTIKHELGLAFDLARNLGLRASEITNLKMNDFVFDKQGNLKTVFIYCSKGGRHRSIYINYLTDKQIDTCLKVYSHFKKYKGTNERLFINKSASYQSIFAKIRDEISENYKFCGIHSMRKEFAKDYYNREIAKGKDDKTVKNILTQILGHNRVEILKNYL